MNQEHAEIIGGFKHFVEARKVFAKYEGKWFSGNDNHIGDIGEYWTMLYFADNKPKLAPSRVSSHDIQLQDGSKLSVKTMSEWNRMGQGGPVKGILEGSWDYLVTVRLDSALNVSKFCVVPLSKVRQMVKEGAPFKWWGWLSDFERDFALLSQ